MTLLAPLGLLGLIGIAVLIIIYILKPNYQQKFISSTYIWKLSLKYRKKKIPTSRLRNILLIICQLIILISLTMLLTQPSKPLFKRSDNSEVVAILDSSASMRTASDKETRFERGVNGILELSEKVFASGGNISVIIADNNAAFLKQGVTAQNKAELKDALDELVSNDACSYGVSDLDAAISLCDNLLKENPSADIYLFTDKTFLNKPQTVNVVDVTEEGEWNVAIIGAYTQIEENYYSIYVDIACYGRDHIVDFSVTVNGAEDLGTGASVNYSFNHSVSLQSGVVKTVIFKYAADDGDGDTDSELVEIHPVEANQRFYSYESVHISIQEDDSLKEDNLFDIYSGKREVLKVQYASSKPNPFVFSTLLALRNYYANLWDFQITEIKPDDEAANEGFDFYIFEHSKMPKVMPTDGVVFLFDPDENIPADAGITIGGVKDLNKIGSALAKEADHPLIEGVQIDKIEVSRYTTVASYDPTYTVLASCAADPVVFMCDEGVSKVVVMNFSVHYSNITMRNDFALFMLNMFDYFIPSIVPSNSFEVNESVTLKSRGEVLNVSGSSGDLIFNNFPAVLNLNIPGTYTLTQTTYFDKYVIERIFVRVPASESDIKTVEDRLKEPYTPKDNSDVYRDLAVIFAAILVAVLFAEWWLQTRENG